MNSEMYTSIDLSNESKEKNSSKVSIVIPCFNSERTIARCLDSILAQSHTCIEILIYDDASHDATLSIIQAYEASHPNLKVFYGAENMGAGYARNHLLSKATGEYIAFIDADDEWHPQKISVQLNEMHLNNADVAICHYNVFDEEKKFRGTRTVPVPVNLATLHITNWIPMSMAIFKSSLKNSRNMPALRRRQDYAFWLTLFRHNPGLRCHVSRHVLGSYYKTQGSLSSNPIINFRDTLKMFRETQNYPLLLCVFFVLMNASVRVFRV